MGRTIHCTVFALVVAAALSGCSSDPNEAALKDAAQLASEVRAFCDAARANIEAAKPLTALTSSGPPPHPAEQVSQVLGPLRDSNEAMLEAAPKQVRPDAEVAAQLAEMQLAVFESSGGDPAAATTDAAYLAKVKESQPATTRLRGFMRTACRIDPG